MASRLVSGMPRKRAPSVSDDSPIEYGKNDTKHTLKERIDDLIYHWNLLSTGYMIDAPERWAINTIAIVLVLCVLFGAAKLLLLLLWLLF
ncbi:MAG: hypothetical protein MHM6MM_003462 [Cercozoa sp. M6MM]